MDNNLKREIILEHYQNPKNLNNAELVKTMRLKYKSAVKFNNDINNLKMTFFDLEEENEEQWDLDLGSSGMK